MGASQAGDTCQRGGQLGRSKEKWDHGEKRPPESHHASYPPKELSGLDFPVNHPTFSMSVTTSLHEKKAARAKPNTSQATHPWPLSTAPRRVHRPAGPHGELFVSSLW